MGDKHPGDRLSAAIFEGRAIDLMIVAADLRANGIEPFNIERQARQLEFNAKQVRDGLPQTTLHT